MEYVKGMQCKSPDHPPSHPKERMVCVGETPEVYAFACHACMEVRRLYSVQVKTKVAYREEVRKRLGREGRLMTKPPVINRRLLMRREEK